MTALEMSAMWQYGRQVSASYTCSARPLASSQANWDTVRSKRIRGDSP